MFFTMPPTNDIFYNVQTYGPVPEANDAVTVFSGKYGTVFSIDTAVLHPNSDTSVNGRQRMTHGSLQWNGPGALSDLVVVRVMVVNQK